MLKIKSSISWRLKAAVVCLGLLQVSACGFRSLYSGQGTDDSVSGREVEQRTASVFIDEIADRVGQILYQSLSDKLIPLGEPENPQYRLSVNISGISTSEQAVRRDNLATRYLMTMTVKYSLYSYPENKKIMSGDFTRRSNYDVQRSPYATDVAEQTTKERLAKIMGNDIALHVAAFLKGYKEIPDEKTDTAEETSAEEQLVNGEKQTDMISGQDNVPVENETVSEEIKQAEEQ